MDVHVYVMYPQLITQLYIWAYIVYTSGYIHAIEVVVIYSVLYGGEMHKTRVSHVLKVSWTYPGCTVDVTHEY